MRVWARGMLWVLLGVGILNKATVVSMSADMGMNKAEAVRSRKKRGVGLQLVVR